MREICPDGKFRPHQKPWMAVAVDRIQPISVLLSEMTAETMQPKNNVRLRDDCADMAQKVYAAY